MDNSTDYYAQSAEMYDVLSESHWLQRKAFFIEMIQAMNVSTGNWLNIGSGTGQELAIIAHMLPQVHLFAIEPSVSMRIGLMTRLMMETEIQKQVTVIANSFQEAQLPDTFSAATLCGCIGYFNQEDRAELWQRLASGLVAGGAILVDTMTFEHPQHVEEIQVSSKQIGHQTYETYLKGEPTEQDIIRWDMRFRVVQENSIQREFSIQRDWHTFSLQQVIDEASDAGFSAEIFSEHPVPTAILRLS